MECQEYSEETFLQGWIGECLAALWLELKGYEVKCRVQQPRGGEESKSSGDIDLIASKEGETVYAEVKFWSKKACLNPSWFVLFMLERKKLNTLFESHDRATKHMLIFRHPATGSFSYSNFKYIEMLMNKYEVPKEFLERLTGQSNVRFVEETLKYLIHKKVNNALEVQVIYFDQIIKELKEIDSDLKEIKSLLQAKLQSHLEVCFMELLYT